MIDYAQIGIVVSLLSVSVAVLKINKNHNNGNGNGNNKKLDNYINRHECNKAMEGLKDYIGVKVDGLEKKVDTAIMLLKNNNSNG